MRIGIDIDGVIANFFAGYESLIISIAGKDLFGDNKYPNEFPKVWNWPETFGYGPEVVSQAWAHIKGNPGFWATLGTLPDINTWLLWLKTAGSKHDIYFITDRPGAGAKYWTERWFNRYGYDNATILISRNGKGAIVAALDLELYIDDKVENILDVQTKAPNCRAYLAPQYLYNTNHPDFNKVTRSCHTVWDILKRL